MKRGEDVVRELNAWNDRNEKDGLLKRTKAIRKMLLKKDNTKDSEDDNRNSAKALVKIADNRFVDILELLPQSLDEKYSRSDYLSGQIVRVANGF